MVISQVTAWADPVISNFDYTHYLAGVRTLSDLKKRGRCTPTFCASCVGNSERWACPGRIARYHARY